MSIVVCENLVKQYQVGSQTIYALNDVSISVEQGEYVAVLGKSGSGKSTLMNMIGLIDVPTSGRVLYMDKDVSGYQEKEKARFRNEKIGYIFQSFYLEPSYTAYMNVEMPLLIAGEMRKNRREKVMEALKMVGLEERARNRADALSGGERQRVCIARALVNNPDVILADEPCGNLDTQNSAQIMGLFDSLHGMGKTIILITHNEEDARKAQRRIYMKDGKVVE